MEKKVIAAVVGVLVLALAAIPIMAGISHNNDINGPTPTDTCNAQNAGKTKCVPPAPPIHPNDRAQVYTCTAGGGGTYSWVFTTMCAKGVGCNDGGTECQMEAGP